MSYGSRLRAERRFGLSVAFVLVACMLGRGPTFAQQSPLTLPAESVNVVQPGWNLVSLGSGSVVFGRGLSTTLYTLGPADADYRVLQLQNFDPGTGFWVYTASANVILYTGNNVPAVSVTLPAGKCAMVGNPSASNSAQVVGADRVYVYSPVTSSYTQQTLLGIGRGAWACNDQATDEQVTIGTQGYVAGIPPPPCCNPTPQPPSGKAMITFTNDSPYPLSIALAQIDPLTKAATGTVVSGGSTPCSSCVEYDPTVHNQQGCNPTAPTGSISAPPGRYLLHVQSEGRNVPDLQGVVDLQADVAYQLCYWISATRSTSNLP
jgi:hypothetical protein